MLLSIIPNTTNSSYLDILHPGLLKLFIKFQHKNLETVDVSNIITEFRSYGKSHQEGIDCVAKKLSDLFELSLIDFFFIVFCDFMTFSFSNPFTSLFIYFFKIFNLSFILVIKILNYSQCFLHQTQIPCKCLRISSKI